MATAWEEPPRGSALRETLMDAVRPHAEWVFGTPLVFRVDDLRVAGDVGFAMLEPLRPDGRAMGPGDLIRDHGAEDVFELGGPSMLVLYKRSGETWVAVHHAIGATDAWWAWADYCVEYRAVIPEVCD